MDELDDFLKAYEAAANSRDFDRVSPLISDAALFWFTDGSFHGKEAIRQAFEATWDAIRDETYSISNVNWLGRGDELAACTYSFTSDGISDGVRQTYSGRGTSVFVKVDGRWQVVHEHLSGNL